MGYKGEEYGNVSNEWEHSENLWKNKRDRAGTYAGELRVIPRIFREDRKHPYENGRKRWRTLL